MPSSFSRKREKPIVPRSVTFSGSMGEHRQSEGQGPPLAIRPVTANNNTSQVQSTEVRRARMDCVLFTRSAHETPRSASYSRPKVPRSLSARPPRSNSANRLKQEAEADEKEKREMAEAAFQAWIKRKRDAPRQPRASPSREQIEEFTKADARQRVMNTWHNKSIQRTIPQVSSTSTSTTPPQENGHTE